MRHRTTITVGIVDHLKLLAEGITTLINGMKSFAVVLNASNGQDAIEKLKELPAPPDILLVSIEMPVMSGLETAQKIKAAFPAIRLVALGLNDSEKAINDMLQAGCCAYISKDIAPSELDYALRQIATKDFYRS